MTREVGPNFGLTYGFQKGEHDWGDDVNNNFEKLDALIHITVKGTENDAPSSVTDGDCYIVGDTPAGAFSAANTGDIAVYTEYFENESASESASTSASESASFTFVQEWVFYTPKDGWILIDTSNDYKLYYWNGTASNPDWVEIQTGAAPAEESSGSAESSVWTSPIPTTGLLCEYLGDISGGQLLDSSGNARHGTITGTVTEDTSHPLGIGMDFTSNGRVEIPSAAWVSGDGSRTIAMWFWKASQPTGWETVTENNDWATDDRFGFLLPASNYQLYLTYNRSAGDSSYDVGDYTGEWHFIAWTYDGSTTKLFYDSSTPVETWSVSGLSTDTYKVYIGANKDNSGYFNGKLARYRVYNRALSTSEMHQLANETNVQQETTPAFLDFGSVSVEGDESSLQNDTVTIDPNDGSWFEHICTDDTDFEVIVPADGIVRIYVQLYDAGSYNISFQTQFESASDSDAKNIKWLGGSPSFTASGYDIVTLFIDSSGDLKGIVN